MSTRTNNLGRHLIVYYGPVGSGKSYTAEMEYPAAQKITVIKTSMTPAELLDGGLREAMESGEAVIIEGVNYLSESCLNFLLKVCDGRTEYQEDGLNIKIEDNFKVVATARFWDGSAEFSGYDKRIALLLELIAGADARECYHTPATVVKIALGN